LPRGGRSPQVIKKGNWTLSGEKPPNIKKFAKEYITKVIRRIKEKRNKQRCRPSASGFGSPSRRELVGNGTQMPKTLASREKVGRRVLKH